MVDAIQSDIPMAIKAVNAFKPFDLLWFEEPIILMIMRDMQEFMTNRNEFSYGRKSSYIS